MINTINNLNKRKKTKIYSRDSWRPLAHTRFSLAEHMKKAAFDWLIEEEAAFLSSLGRLSAPF